MKTRALVLCDDQWHPAETVRRGLGALKNPPVDFQFLDDGSRWSPELMKNFPVVIVAKANHVSATDQTPWLTEQRQGAFRNFVRHGGGLLLLHAGVCYKELPEMRRVTGGAFLSHPEQCSVVIQPVAGHPLSAGVDVFVKKDEHYQVAQDDLSADVFLLTLSANGIHPAGWTRAEGSGRVCALTPGHNLEVWLDPNFQKLLGNALHWTANGTKVEVKSGSKK
jgi:type 1 glutamine amidotransferase